jgi:crotonobetainyl-CoA:carnitine CoA-transferase CaiB-like acyl-CoA transferase
MQCPDDALSQARLFGVGTQLALGEIRITTKLARLHYDGHQDSQQKMRIPYSMTTHAHSTDSTSNSRPQAGSSPAAGPLAGVKVLDLTAVLMGPSATQTLAALGAEVIKIEPPDGDNVRNVGPMRNAGMGHIFLHVNSGKKSVVLDLKKPAAVEALLRLAEQTDVMISNVRPQAMARLGLDYATVKARNPKIIYVSCVGFGQEGPYAAKPAYDDLIQGAVGLPWLMQRYRGPEPGYAPVTLADRVTGLHAVYAVTAALYAREKTGLGQLVEVPMFEALTQFVLGDHLAGLSFEPPLDEGGKGGYGRLLTPHRRPYGTRDGFLCVLIYNDKHWQSFFKAIGDPGQMSTDPRFKSHQERSANIDWVYGQVAEILRGRTTAEWRQLLDQADIPNMPINSPQDLLNDAHLKAVGFFTQVDHPSEGQVHTMRTPTSWSATPCSAPTPAPQLGEHTDSVLRAAGFTQAEIDELSESKSQEN